MNAKKLKVCTFPYGNFSVECHTENLSSLIDKLVRLSAKLTESYASDVIYVAEELNKAKAAGESSIWLLFFRESGVDYFLLPMPEDRKESGVRAPSVRHASQNMFDVPEKMAEHIAAFKDAAIQMWVLELYVGDVPNSYAAYLNRVNAAFTTD